MVIEKGILVSLGVVFAGIVACKVVQKKKPQVIKGLKKKVEEIKEKTTETLKTAREAFREGYSQA